jgi:hypothetical protein
MRSRVRQEAPEDGIADAPLEAPQRLLARLALRGLLAVVGTTPVGHRGRRSCGRCRWRAPAPAPRASAARPPPTRPSPPTSPPGAYPESAGVLYGPTALGEPLRLKRSRDLKPSLGPAGSDHARAAPLWLRRAPLRLPRRLVGIDPDQDVHERTHLRFGRTSMPSACAKGIPTTSGLLLPHLV